ncbi:MAG: hypothetical protein K6G88_08585, partial [Lachnospiraceae bacterium]|nr:hypothetical protein [Lachnospiraceae bacterium]
KFLSGRIIERNKISILPKIVFSILVCIVSISICCIISLHQVNNFIGWCVKATEVSIVVGVVTVAFATTFFHKDFIGVIEIVKRIVGKKGV